MRYVMVLASRSNRRSENVRRGDVTIKICKSETTIVPHHALDSADEAHCVVRIRPYIYRGGCVFVTTFAQQKSSSMDTTAKGQEYFHNVI